MDYDTSKIDETVLAVLVLTLHDHNGAWKAFDWDALNRLHESGFIENPRNKNKSVIFTVEGLRKSEKLFRTLFQKSD